MPLSKSDNPGSSTSAKAAKAELLDEAAGAPPAMEEAVEALPEGDEVEKATKEAMQADSAQDEAKAKLKAVEASPDAADTPSGYALGKAAKEKDPVKAGEIYRRAKAAKRFGVVPAEDE